LRLGIDWAHRHDAAFAGYGRRLCSAVKQYAAIFYQGDEAFSGLLEFAEKYHVTSAHFTAIGALSGATLGWFDPQRKMYKKIPINGQNEVIGMSGDIALYQGKPVVHTHMVVGTSDGTTRAGHVLDAYVSPTLEVMVTVDPVAMQRRFDSGNGSHADRSSFKVLASQVFSCFL
jgi:uncharacterized protein